MFEAGEKVVCEIGFSERGYGPPHLLKGKEYTVTKCDKTFVWVDEIYNGRYGFYINVFTSKKHEK